MRDKIDEMYLSKSWKEMEAQLDQYMPVRKPWGWKRYLPLLLLLCGATTTGILYFKNDQSLPNMMTVDEIQVKESNIPDDFNPGDHLLTHIPEYLLETEGIAEPSSIQQQENFPDAQTIDGSQQPSPRSITDNNLNSDYGLYTNSLKNHNNSLLNPPSIPNNHEQKQVMTQEEMLNTKPDNHQIDHKEHRGLLNFPFLPVLTNRLIHNELPFGIITIPLSQPIAGQSIVMNEGDHSGMKGLGLVISSRALPGTFPNGELGLVWNIPVGKRLRISPQIGVGYDNYRWSTPAIEESLRGHFSSHLSRVQINEETRKGYFTATLNLQYPIFDRLYLAAGAGRRLYSFRDGVLLFSAISELEDGQMPDGQASSSENIIIQPSQHLDFFQWGFSYRINRTFYLTGHHVMQMNNTVSDVRLSGFASNPIDLDRRNEIRLGLMVDF
ncbi:MAG TPA: hypothetical protein PKC30_05095 [Saprospiraceae bacterium]|nr:hypothetical protein [Saprospiraceae bacterium]